MNGLFPPTHDVLNQPPPLEVNLLTSDLALTKGLRREGGAWAEAKVHAYAERLRGQGALWSAPRSSTLAARWRLDMDVPSP